jgi:pimeloyl-ACP methyl ester carboxylesterase
VGTFVLVHGAWHGGWCWKKVVPLLESLGHRVATPTLSGLGERADLLSREVGLDTHIADVAGLIEEHDLAEVVLVGHSYAGVVITGVADRVRERIGRLIYLDTFVPRDGDSMRSVAPLVIGAFLLQARLRGDGWRVPPPAPEQFGVREEPDRSWVKSSLTAHPLKSLNDHLSLADPDIDLRFPRTHIRCGRGGRLEHLAQKVLARRPQPPQEPGWRLRGLETAHDCMITDPRGLVELLIEE